VDHLLAAVAALGDQRVTLSVVGDGPERPRLERLAADLGIEDRTEFLGLRDDVDELLRRSDLFVHPAIWGEAFGLTITEAMASGCPVVASNVGGIPELIEDGITGLLVPPADDEALRKAIARLIDDRDLRHRLSVQARARVLERFGLEQCVQAHVEWCESALAGAHSVDR
jgi:glycosyltransferase involved in cell wall biosynthesis